jgi:hypothetical protein
LQKLLTIVLSTCSLVVSGCATTQYTVNGQEPKRDNTMLILGSIAIIGAAAALGPQHKGKQACKSYVSGPNGTSTVTTYQTKCP